jgi:hypothetical protein
MSVLDSCRSCRSQIRAWGAAYGVVLRWSAFAEKAQENGHWRTQLREAIKEAVPISRQRRCRNGRSQAARQFDLSSALFWSAASK